MSLSGKEVNIARRAPAPSSTFSGEVTPLLAPDSLFEIMEVYLGPGPAFSPESPGGSLRPPALPAQPGPAQDKWCATRLWAAPAAARGGGRRRRLRQI